MLEIIDLQCGVWPHGEVPDGFHEPVVSDLPVLLMSGERDPVTPPHYAEMTAEIVLQQPEPGCTRPGAFRYEKYLPA